MVLNDVVTLVGDLHSRGTSAVSRAFAVTAGRNINMQLLPYCRTNVPLPNSESMALKLAPSINRFIRYESTASTQERDGYMTLIHGDHVIVTHEYFNNEHRVHICAGCEGN